MNNQNENLDDIAFDQAFVAQIQQGAEQAVENAFQAAFEVNGPFFIQQILLNNGLLPANGPQLLAQGLIVMPTQQDDNPTIERENLRPRSRP